MSTVLWMLVAVVTGLTGALLYYLLIRRRETVDA